MPTGPVRPQLGKFTGPPSKIATFKSWNDFFHNKDRMQRSSVFKEMLLDNNKPTLEEQE